MQSLVCLLARPELTFVCSLLLLGVGLSFPVHSSLFHVLTSKHSRESRLTLFQPSRSINSSKRKLAVSYTQHCRCSAMRINATQICRNRPHAVLTCLLIYICLSDHWPCSRFSRRIMLCKGFWLSKGVYVCLKQTKSGPWEGIKFNNAKWPQVMPNSQALQVNPMAY